MQSSDIHGLWFVCVMMFWFLASTVVYFVPSIIAMRRNHVNAAAIAIINFFFGWTLLGWVISLAWSLSAQREERVPATLR